MDHHQHMNLCNKKHKAIAFVGGDCPICISRDAGQRVEQMFSPTPIADLEKAIIEHALDKLKKLEVAG